VEVYHIDTYEQMAIRLAGPMGSHLGVWGREGALSFVLLTAA
jgi:hypothetical protein